MSSIQEIEISAAEAKRKVDLKNKLDKLMSNREFKTLITEGYLKDELVRLGLISASTPTRSEVTADTVEKIKAVAHFDMYLRNVITQGMMAEQELENFEDELDELRAEGAE